MSEYAHFDRWEDVLAHVRDRRAIYYRAPLDHLPHRVKARVWSGGKKVRVFPDSRDADPFTADEGHLDRFLKRR